MKLGRPATGAGYLLRGLRLLLRPGLRRFLVVPVTLNVVIFSVAAWIALTRFQLVVDRYLPQESWLDYLRWLLWPLFALTFMLLVFYTFTTIANLLAAPFNGLLSSKVEQLVTGRIPPDLPSGLVADILPSLFMELRKIVYFLVRALPLLLLFLIPGIQLIAPLLWIAFSAWFLALEYLDYPMGNHGLKFKQQLGQLKRLRLLALGFGGAVNLLMLIPLLNLVAMPAAVAGATLLWCDQSEEPEILPRAG